MTKYIEYFQIESKSLLKRFKQKDPATVALCKKYFESKDDISLMNAQHVIAKEHGFNSWNDLIKQEPHKLAESLIVAKNKTLKNPFKLWHGCRIVTGYEENKYPLDNPEDYKLEYVSKKKSFIRGYDKYISFEHLDVSEYDLSGMDPLKIRYSEDTKWPKEASKLPKGFNPKEFLETRKNPGLGVHKLHKAGIKGQGRNIAIIDWSDLFNHIEYHNNLKGYEEIGEKFVRGESSGILSSIVGKTCGVAPLANAYYYAADHKNFTSYENYATALKNIIELHKELKSKGKSGIDVIYINSDLLNEAHSSREGSTEARLLIKEAESLGIWCNGCGRLDFKENTKLSIGYIYCKLDGNLDNPDDYISIRNPSSKFKLVDYYENTLCFPTGAKTVALGVKMDEYAFEHLSGPYSTLLASGLYLLAKSVKETITPYEFFELGLKTGDFREGVGTIINPVRLIESLK